MVRKIIPLTLLLTTIACFYFYGCSKKNPTAPATAGNISGIITRAIDGTVLVGANIFTDPPTSAVVSDSLGRYSITGLKAGDYTLTASKNLYINASVGVSVTEGKTTTANIALSDSGSAGYVLVAPILALPVNNSTDMATELEFSWCFIYLATSYTFQIATDNSFLSIILNRASLTDLKTTVTGLNSSTDYYWRVRAVNAYGVSPWSAIWRFQTFFPGSITIDMVSIPAGNFIMGSLSTDPYAQTYSELPQHTVYLDAYQMGKYEITNTQYKAFMDAGGYNNSAYWTIAGWAWRTAGNITEPAFWSSGSYNSGMAYPNYPVVGVNWYEATAFCQWAGLHLPTEAQWEKTARGTDPTNYWPWGNTWDASKCNSNSNASPDTFTYSSPVGFFSNGQSPYGAYDMAGNILEWCSDWYDHDYYSISPSINPIGPDTGTIHVMRSGLFGTDAQGNRCASRGSGDPTDRHYFYGFRVAE